jgi:hypothetical protein
VHSGPSAHAAQNRYDCGRPIVAAISQYCTNPDNLQFLVDQGCRLSTTVP